MTKLLLDESIPKRLARSFPPSFEIDTVQSIGWSGTKSGQLLVLTAENGFDALITADQNIEHQQNLANVRCAIIVMHAHRIRFEDLKPLVADVVALFESEVSGVIHVGA